MARNPHRTCVQCGADGVLGEGMHVMALPDGTWDPAAPICTDRAGCRARWWARFAYEMELAQ